MFRGMLREGDLPRVGPARNALGVVTSAEKPENAPREWVPDIDPDGAGVVRTATGGMSVAPSLSALPAHRIPERLRERGVTKAVGSNKLFVWSHGDGDFQAGPVAPGLALRPDAGVRPTHGVVEPAAAMTVEAFRERLAATAGNWAVDEPSK